MGNWRTVNMTGTMSAADAAKLRRLLDEGDWRAPSAVPDNADCLSFSSTHPGLCGLGDWPAEAVNRSGNLAERDYTVMDVQIALESLVRVAPSLLLTVHCGGDYESDECVATIRVGEGLVRTGPPEVERIDPPSPAQMNANLWRNLLR